MVDGVGWALQGDFFPGSTVWLYGFVSTVPFYGVLWGLCDVTDWCCCRSLVVESRA